MKEKDPIDVLFSGKPEFFGGLSNEEELAQVCPEEFKKNNPWSDYVSRVFYYGADIRNWKWVTDDQNIRLTQLGYLRGVLGGFALDHKDKEAVAGWMLSRILTEVPEYLELKK